VYNNVCHLTIMSPDKSKISHNLNSMFSLILSGPTVMYIVKYYSTSSHCFPLGSVDMTIPVTIFLVPRLCSLLIHDIALVDFLERCNFTSHVLQRLNGSFSKMLYMHH